MVTSAPRNVHMQVPQPPCAPRSEWGVWVVCACVRVCVCGVTMLACHHQVAVANGQRPTQTRHPAQDAHARRRWCGAASENMRAGRGDTVPRCAACCAARQRRVRRAPHLPPRPPHQMGGWSSRTFKFKLHPSPPLASPPPKCTAADTAPTGASTYRCATAVAQRVVPLHLQGACGGGGGGGRAVGVVR